MVTFTERITPEIAKSILEDAQNGVRKAYDVEQEAANLVQDAIESGDSRKIRSATGIHGQALKAWRNKVITVGILQETLDDKTDS